MAASRWDELVVRVLSTATAGVVTAANPIPENLLKTIRRRIDEDGDSVDDIVAFVHRRGYPDITAADIEAALKSASVE